MFYIKPGKNYRFRISDSKNEDEVVFTNRFVIKRRVPLFLKALPVIMAGSVLYLMLDGKGENGTQEKDLPVAPFPSFN